LRAFAPGNGERETRGKGENLINGYSDKKKIPPFPLSPTPPLPNRGLCAFGTGNEGRGKIRGVATKKRKP